MGRNRVFSFTSLFSARSRSPSTAASSPPESPVTTHKRTPSDPFPDHEISHQQTPLPPKQAEYYGSSVNSSPRSSTHRHHRSSSSRSFSPTDERQPPLMEPTTTEDVVPELLPIFSFLNSHANKLYQEGYFLKLEDQNTQGRPNADRTWTECFAQLVGTVLSLWDAAELDAAGEDGEVLPKFINLTDASIKMIESLPTRAQGEQPLQNILSISTAGKNRYLLHFNSHHSLVQWTAGIRLAMYEHSILQEAYTGSLIAGKGKTLNNINVIMERARFKTEAWVRVRFGAGVPWRRCWCVISPPDEKEYAKQQKDLKKRSAYDRSAVPNLKGDIKFYDTKVEGKKQKKMQPIATITDAFAAYAVYPEAKALVDASTLIKVEGNVGIHTDPPSSSEGFVFIMPETHPMVTGFEMLLRFLFPTWDTFALYGRPGKLVASTLDQRSLMFAMPKHKRYGYLDMSDVTELINDKMSPAWSERDWRKKLKDSTGVRMNAIEDGSRPQSRSASRTSGHGPASPPARSKVGFADDQPARTDSAPPNTGNWQSPVMGGAGRNASDPNLAAAGQPPLRGPSPLAGPGPDSTSRFAPGDRANKAYHSPELRRANSRLSQNTLAQMAGASANGLNNFSQQNDPTATQGRPGEVMAGSGPSVHSNAALSDSYANTNGPRPGLNGPGPNRMPGNQQPSPGPSQGPRSPMPPGGFNSPNAGMQGSPSRPPQDGGRPYPGGPGPQGPPGGPGQRPPPPPGHGPGPDGYRRGPPLGPGGPGGPGPQGRPGPGNDQYRRAIPMRGPPPSADDIIDSYSDAGGPPPGRGPMPPPHGRPHPPPGPPGPPGQRPYTPTGGRPGMGGQGPPGRQYSSDEVVRKPMPGPGMQQDPRQMVPRQGQGPGGAHRGAAPPPQGQYGGSPHAPYQGQAY
ncbi:Putative PH domain-containing protein [[Torrubiella] hemipterigena]|uniref:Putative PH domain-containing protein n=1 Tax=[Torrubiella] hemipterigena TaxID=1531966 RepID=A0A0A1TA96_9HYPO|nr:Putative PH domain-containing protein [[Torrubiella] hemipterigena]